MIAVSHNNSNFHYIKWIASENGPLVTHFGIIQSDSNFEYNQFSDILQSISDKISELPLRIQLSLDNSAIKYSFNRLDNQKIDDQLEWHQSQTIDPDFRDQYDTFQYPIMGDKSGLLNIHLLKNTKSNILDSIRKMQAELRVLSVGIYSAEEGARNWFSANKLDSYIIWKMGKSRINEALIIRDGQLISHMFFKKLSNKIKLQQVFGSYEQSEEFINEIELIDQSKVTKFSNIDRVFVYSSNTKSKDLKEVNELDIENLRIINPFDVLEIESDKKINPIYGSTFAETGISFRGVDV